MRVCRVAFCNPSLYFSSMPIESNLTSLHDLANLPGCPLKVPNFSLLCLFGTDLPKRTRRLGRGGFKKWSQKEMMRATWHSRVKKAVTTLIPFGVVNH